MFSGKPTFAVLKNGQTGKEKFITEILLDSDEHHQVKEQLLAEVILHYEANFRAVDANMFNTLSASITMDEDYPKYALSYVMSSTA